MKKKLDIRQNKIALWFKKYSLTLFRIGSFLFLCLAIAQFISGKKEAIFGLLSIANSVYWFNMGPAGFTRIYEPTWQSKMSRIALLFYIPPTLCIIPLIFKHKDNIASLIGVAVLGYILVFIFSIIIVKKHKATAIKNKEYDLKLCIQRTISYSIIENANSITGSRALSVQEIEEESQRLYELWIKIPIPTERKLELIKHNIQPEYALDPDIVRMNSRDLEVVKALSVTLNANSFPALG